MREKWTDFMEEMGLEDIKGAPNTLFQAIKDAGTIYDFVSARGELERLKSEFTAPAISVSHRHYIPEIEIEH